MCYNFILLCKTFKVIVKYPNTITRSPKFCDKCVFWAELHKFLPHIHNWPFPVRSERHTPSIIMILNCLSLCEQVLCIYRVSKKKRYTFILVCRITTSLIRFLQNKFFLLSSFPSYSTAKGHNSRNWKFKDKISAHVLKRDTWINTETKSLQRLLIKRSR